jgi:hypothetical protein
MHGSMRRLAGVQQEPPASSALTTPAAEDAQGGSSTVDSPPEPEGAGAQQRAPQPLVLDLPPNLVLTRLDGSRVPQPVVNALVHVWGLLLGRLRFGDTATLLQYQPGWPGGWVVGDAALAVST